MSRLSDRSLNRELSVVYMFVLNLRELRITSAESPHAAVPVRYWIDGNVTSGSWAGSKWRSTEAEEKEFELRLAFLILCAIECCHVSIGLRTRTGERHR